MKGLLLHCGGREASRDEVFEVPVPEATSTYTPLAYESFVTRVERQLAVDEIKVVEGRFALAKNGQRLFGLMQLAFPGVEARDYGCVLGIRNSYDKSFATGLCIGATVFVCDNLSFHGSTVTFERKHTPNLLRDLAWMISEAVSELPALFATQSKTFDVYRGTRLSDSRVHDLVIRSYDAGALNATDIPRVLKAWRDEANGGGRSAWRLFNSVTGVIKGDLWRLPARTGALHRVLDEACGLGPGPEGAAGGADAEPGLVGPLDDHGLAITA